MKTEIEIYDNAELDIIHAAYDKILAKRAERYREQVSPTYPCGCSKSKKAAAPGCDAPKQVVSTFGEIIAAKKVAELRDVPPMSLAEAVADDAPKPEQVQPPADRIATVDEAMAAVNAAKARGIGIDRVREIRGPQRIPEMSDAERGAFVMKLQAVSA